MGNSSSSSGRGHHDETVDFGHLVPQGVYTGTRDWDQTVVAHLICARKLAPFYRPLEDYDESWDDDQILAARKELPDTENAGAADPSARTESSSSHHSSKPSHGKRPSLVKEPSKLEASVYRGAVDCPICFLYYPPNINHSRCCDQAICTECFVQIKRSEPTTTHLVSEPAACPYCVQDNFGVVYTPPPWRAGIGSEGGNSPWSDSPKGYQQSIETSAPYPTHKRRQKSFGADSPEVVTTDQIRPDWEAKLAAIRAAVTRRANRRIIMRQVGDRLIPVGVTSGRVHALTPEEATQAEAAAADNGSSRRSRRRQQAPQNNGFEQLMGLGGQDLEELMIMEAMRLSMLDHEEHQRKEAEEKKKKEAEEARRQAESASDASGPSIIEGRSSLQVSRSSQPSSSPAASTRSPSPSPSPSQQPTGRDSLSTHRNSLSLSRSRSPSPSISTLQSDWRRTSSPPPFSTVTAALSAASTASAILGGDLISSMSAASITDAPEISTSSTSGPATNGIPADESVPTITVQGRSSSPCASFVTPAHGSDSTATAEDLSRPPPVHLDSVASSMFSTDSTMHDGQSYNNLPSSPDSESVARVPLLASEGDSQGDLTGSALTPKIPTSTAEVPTDYFGENARQA